MKVITWLIGVAVLLAIVVVSCSAGEARLQFDANNQVGSVEFFAERKPAGLDWSDPAQIVAEGIGVVIGRTERQSGSVTASQSGHAITLSADFFVETDHGKAIEWNSGETGLVVNVQDPRNAIALASASVSAGSFTLATDRVELVDEAVPPGSWTFRVAARSVSGLVSNYSNDSTKEFAPFGPSSNQVVTLGGLSNLSARAFVGSDAEILIGGVVTRSRTTLLARGVGPGLDRFGIPRTLADPTLTFFQGQNVFASNDDWNPVEVLEASNQVYAFNLDPGSKDSAMLVTLDPGQFTVHLSGKSGATGVALLELYEVTR